MVYTLVKLYCEKEVSYMNQIPKDPVMLLSYLNTQLRDFYSSLEDCCGALSLDQEQVAKTLGAIGYKYNPEQNQFI